MASRRRLRQHEVETDSKRGFHGIAAQERPSLIEEQRTEEALSRPIDSLGFEGRPKGMRTRVLKALDTYRNPRGPVLTIGDIVKMGEEGLLTTSNMGKKVVAAIKEELSSLGVELPKKGEARYLTWRERASSGARPIESLDFGNPYHTKRVVASLKLAGMVRVEDLRKLFGPDAPLIRGVGDITLERIRRQLGERGIMEREKPFIIVTDEGAIKTNLSKAQIQALLRLAKLELEDLRDVVQPHQVKVIGELLDMVEVSGKE